jgi:hypothetical protein
MSPFFRVMRGLLGLDVWPSWPGVRLVANDGLPRGVSAVKIHRSDLWIRVNDRGPLPWVFPRRAGRCFMSTVINSEKMNASVLERPPEDALSVTREQQGSLRIPTGRREPEPLEEAFDYCEAPERGAQSDREAPDAGEAQFLYDDREFRHGRSRG